MSHSKHGLWGGQSCPQAGLPAGWTRWKAGPQAESLPHKAAQPQPKVGRTPSSAPDPLVRLFVIDCCNTEQQASGSWRPYEFRQTLG